MLDTTSKVGFSVFLQPVKLYDLLSNGNSVCQNKTG